MTADERKLNVGSVVQINPAMHLGAADGLFAYCLMIVTEIRPWGAIGNFLIPDKRGEPPLVAPFRATWEQMEYIGEAYF